MTLLSLALPPLFGLSATWIAPDSWRVSTNSADNEPLLTEAATFRRLGLPPRRGIKLRNAGILTPDQTTAGGHIRLYRADRLSELAAKINPQPDIH